MFLNIEKKFSFLPAPHLVVTFRADEHANGPGDTTVHVFLSDSSDRVAGRAKTVRHLELTGEVAQEAESVLVTLMNELRKRDKGQFREFNDGMGQLFLALRMELFDFCGLVTKLEPVTATDLPKIGGLVEVLDNVDSDDGVQCSFELALTNDRILVDNGQELKFATRVKDKDPNDVYAFDFHFGPPRPA
jgi:hypothetical protein